MRVAIPVAKIAIPKKLKIKRIAIKKISKIKKVNNINKVILNSYLHITYLHHPYSYRDMPG